MLVLVVKGHTCLAIDLYPILQELLQRSNLHDLVLHWLGTVDDEGLLLDLLDAFRLRLLCHWSHHDCKIFSGSVLDWQKFRPQNLRQPILHLASGLGMQYILLSISAEAFSSLV